MQNTKTTIPTKIIGPIKIIGDYAIDVKVPLATFEAPLWPSVNRGARVSRLCEGINVTIIKDCMTRSILLEAPDANYAKKITNKIKELQNEIQKLISKASNFTTLEDWNIQLVANLIYLRLSFNTGNAAGHNMATNAAEIIADFLLKEFSKLKYVSVSGNYCVDKKNSAVNGILGRGKYVIAEMTISKEICEKHFCTNPEKIVNLNIKKNLIGSIIAGSVHSANAHFANMLLALYLATGQDAANIIEGSQGITHAEVDANGDLYFSVTLPNIIVGTIGASKDLDFVKQNLKLMDCQEHDAKKLAAIAAATVCCGELSLMAALTNQGELMRSHIAIER